MCRHPPPRLFDNARLYNTEKSQVHQDAIVLEEIFYSQPDPFGNEGSIKPAPPPEPTAPPSPPPPKKSATSRASSSSKASKSKETAAATAAATTVVDDGMGAADGTAETLSNKEMYLRAWSTVREVRDGKRERVRSQSRGAMSAVRSYYTRSELSAEGGSVVCRPLSFWAHHHGMSIRIIMR